LGTPITQRMSRNTTKKEKEKKRHFLTWQIVSSNLEIVVNGRPKCEPI